jgi:transposase
MEDELEVNNKKLSPSGQEQLRLRIIRTAKKNLKPDGKVNATLVAEICECSKGHVSDTWKKYLEGGVTAVKAVKMGRPENSGKLTKDQQAKVRAIIVDKCPNQIKLKGFLWDREQTRALLKREFKVTLSLQAISNYFSKWGFTPQRPRKQNYKQQPEEVQKWLDETYPDIAKRASEEDAEIHWGDETGCQNECNYVKGYAPKGQTPTLPFSGDKLRVNMISSITNQGKLRFMFYEDRFNALIFVTFIKRLVKDAKGRKIFFIVDNIKPHHAKIVKEWVKLHQEEIELFFLPPYCPEYNPDEYLNGNLKREMAKKEYAETKGQIESNARGIMMSIQRNHEHVATFFHAAFVKYAA